MAANKYDNFNYPSAPFDYSHCRRLQTVARLFGMQPAPLAESRVLELGCGDGSNLIPQAENFPAASFVGIDYAQVPIDQGQAVIGQVGLDNIELRAENVLDLDPASGPYDYIIAHGLYSWVPPEVQNRTLELLPQLLAPQGVAFISYNTLPGWHLRRTVRDLMLTHTASIHEPREKVDQARAILQWVTSATKEGSPYRQYMEDEQAVLDRKPDGYLYHDHLEDQNEALYFQEFMRRASQHDLQYLGEAEMAYMFWQDIPPKQQQDLAGLPVEIAEQLMDFIRNRSFRKTLLCRADIDLNRQPSAEVLLSLHYGMEQPASIGSVDLLGPQPMQFQVGGNTLEITEPLAQAAMIELANVFPGSLCVAEISSRAAQRLRLAGAEDVPSEGEADVGVAHFLWTLGSSGILEVYAEPPEMRLEVSERPFISSLVRYHAENAEFTTNRKHVWVRIDDISRRMLTLLDGTRTRDEIVATVAGEIADGKLPREDNARSPDQIAADALLSLAKCCLLIG